VSVAGTTVLTEKWNGQCIAVEDSGYYHAIERDVDTNKIHKPITKERKPTASLLTPIKPLKSTLKSIQHTSAALPPPTLEGGACRMPNMTVVTAVRNNRHDINTNHKQELTKKGSKLPTTQKLPEPHGRVTTPYEGSKPVKTKPLKSTRSMQMHQPHHQPSRVVSAGSLK